MYFKLKKLAIISSHPIQYNAPLFALLAEETDIDLMVFYTWGESSLGPKFDPGFDKVIEWDIPLLIGYNYTFLNNTSKKPGSHHFKGIRNPTLNHEIEAWGADIVWIWGWAFESHLKALIYFKGKKKVWFRGDSTLLDEPKGVSLKKLARRIFLSWVYRYVDKVFYVGTHNKAYYKKHGLNETQLIYSPHAIDNNRFSDSKGEITKKALEWRRKLGFQDDDIVLLFAGKFEPRKNPFFLVDLIKYLESYNVKLLVVGNGPLEYNLRQDLYNRNCVFFLDFQNQSNMPTLYRLADFYILPSVSETWGLAINEALASGTKVIVSKYCGGAIDLINDDNGLIFDPKSELKEVCKYINQRENNITSLVRRESLLVGHSYDKIIESVKKMIGTYEYSN
jgi:glycosyltransferase involved in cell wall biosynthesis